MLHQRLALLLAIAGAALTAPAKPTAPGDYVRTVKHAGLERSYRLHLPPAFDGKTRLPVVLAFHGGGSNARQMERYSGLNAKADQEGFVAVYPNGTGRFKSVLTWNTALPGVYSTRRNVDDVGFTAALLDDLEAVAPVDKRRVYATGISNGAMMCYRLAIELADRIAAIAPVSGTYGMGRKRPKRPVPVVHFHGTEDAFVRFEGGPGKHSRTRFGFMSVAKCIGEWVEFDMCPAKPKVQKLADAADDGTRVRRETYGPGKDGTEVVLYVIEGGGHTWPGATRTLAGFLGPTTRDISANDLMWEFFKRHPMPMFGVPQFGVPPLGGRELGVPPLGGSVSRTSEGPPKGGTPNTPLPPRAVEIPMRDGAKLAADVYLPTKEGEFPTILVQTPYDRRSYRTKRVQKDRLFDREHYAWVIVDWRGFFGSRQAKDVVKPAGRQRGLDGYDAVEWIAAQPWSNGKVGTWGASALGKAQYSTAEQKPPHLVCIAPIVAGHGFKYAGHYYGGVLLKAHTERKDAIGFAGYSKLPKAHPTYDMFWRWVDRASKVNKMDAPALVIGGWFDVNTEGVLETFHALCKKAGPAAREHTRLLMGPWTHTGAARGLPKVGELSFPAAERVSQREGRQFFDYWLRGMKDNGWADRPRVRYFQMGENRWVDAGDWPPATRETRFYLHAGGRLAAHTPDAGGPGDAFTYDPSDPSPTIGGMNLPGRGRSFFGGLLDGSADQSAKVESRRDCLVYTTEPLSAGVPLAGAAMVEVFLASDQRDTDVAVRLCDVPPDGRSMLLTDGIQRMKFRSSLSRESLLKPGNVYRAAVRLVPTSHTFLPGHRIRIVVTSSNYPRYDKAPLPARNTLYRDAERPSALVLPVVE